MWGHFAIRRYLSLCILFFYRARPMNLALSYSVMKLVSIQPCPASSSFKVQSRRNSDGMLQLYFYLPVLYPHESPSINAGGLVHDRGYILTRR